MPEVAVSVFQVLTDQESEGWPPHKHLLTSERKYSSFTWAVKRPCGTGERSGGKQMTRDVVWNTVSYEKEKKKIKPSKVVCSARLADNTLCVV
jgi:hypothetical protein